MSERPILVLCERRTGSNLLCDALAQQPGVNTLEEILNLNNRPFLADLDAKQTLRWLNDQLHEGKQRNLAKVQFEQLERIGSNASALATEIGRCDVIVLFRRDLLAQFLSLKRAERTGEWVVVGNDASASSSRQPAPQIAIDEGEFREFCRLSKSRYEKAIAGLPEPVLVCYEELAAQKDEVIDFLSLSILGKPAVEIEHRIRRQETRAVERQTPDAEQAVRLRSAPEAQHRFATNFERRQPGG